MAGQAFLPHGTTVTFNSIDIGGIVNISLPDETRGVAEKTDNDSSGVRRYLPGLKDGGQFTVTVRRIPGDLGQQACRDNYDAVGASATIQEVVVTLPATATTDSQVATFTFDAFVTSVGGGGLDQLADDTAQFDITFQVDGAVTEALA